MHGLVMKAVKTSQLWEMGEFDWSANEKRYGLVQCGRDLNSDGCRQCLDGLLDLVPKCCGTKVGWAIMSPSCGMRIDDNMFYQTSSSSPPNPGPGNFDGPFFNYWVSCLCLTCH